MMFSKEIRGFLSHDEAGIGEKKKKRLLGLC